MGGYAIAVGVSALAAALVGGLYGVSMLLGSGLTPLRGNPFMSRMPPAEHAASRYHMRWYPVTLLFSGRRH